MMGGEASANIYTCMATSVTDGSGKWSKERLDKWKPGTIVKHYGYKDGSPTVSRCSWSDIEGKRTCDIYPINRRFMTELMGGKMGFIDKFYYFVGMLDVQIFQITGESVFDYIENNGRGAIHRGTCTLK